MSEEKPILTMMERMGYENYGDHYDGLKMQRIYRMLNKLPRGD